MKKGLLIALLIPLVQTSFAQTFTNYFDTDGLVSNNVLCVDANASDNIWFGTQLGVSHFDGTTWTTYETATYPGMADDNILSIFVDGTNRTWIGTDFGCSVLEADAFTTYTTADGLGNNKVQCINQDADGNLWFGTITGLTKFDGAAWTTYDTGDGLPFGGVKSITLNEGNLWLGTGLGGVAIFDGTDFTEITEDDGLISDKIRAIDFSPSGQAWLATAEGVSNLNDADVLIANHTTIFTLPEPDTLNPVVDIKVDGNGVVWAGVYVDYLVSEGGVCAYNGATWFEFDDSDGLAGPVVNGLDIDENNDVWVVTSTGVTKISDHTLELDQSSAKESSTISFYPNPANANVNFDLRADQLGQELVIYNILGEMMMVTNTEINLSIDISNWTPGIYFIIAGQLREKLIVE